MRIFTIFLKGQGRVDDANLLSARFGLCKEETMQKKERADSDSSS